MNIINKTLRGKTFSFVGQESGNGSDLAEVGLIENLNLVTVNQEYKKSTKIRCWNVQF